MTLFIDTASFDPAFNLAAEEYLFRNFREDIVFLYINSPSIIIGKHQNAYEEINLEFVLQNKIPVVRRLSGGGSVFHDEGNLNFTFIRNRKSGMQVNFRENTLPVVEFLIKEGLSPTLGDKNEIREEGLKFSGNAEHFFKNRVLHHGTLLFSSKLKELGIALKPGTGVYKSRAVQSNRTEVTNLKPLLGNIDGIIELKDRLTAFLTSGEDVYEYYKFKEEDLIKIDEIAGSKYRNNDWNYGYGPGYSFTNSTEYNNSKIEIYLEVEKGRITKLDIEGSRDMKIIADRLTGEKHLFSTIDNIIREAYGSEDRRLTMAFFR